VRAGLWSCASVRDLRDRRLRWPCTSRTFEAGDPARAASRRCRRLLGAEVAAGFAECRDSTLFAVDRARRLGERTSACRLWRRPACVRDSGPTLCDADGCGSVRVGLPADAAGTFNSRARAAKTAAARRCISTFWRRGAPEQLLHYLVRSYAVSDQADSVYASVNEFSGVRHRSLLTSPKLQSCSLGLKHGGRCSSDLFSTFK
jgi:hypothetical protein